MRYSSGILTGISSSGGSVEGGPLISLLIEELENCRVEEEDKR